MKNRTAFKLASSTVVIAITMVGCTPASQLSRPASLAQSAAKADQDASVVYEAARVAVQQGEMAEALRLAERTVELAPRDTGYRMLLGDLYLKNGRFNSAETTFTDVLALNPGNERATLSLALSQIALGKNALALVELDRLAQTAAPADLGLAYALAGQPQRAVAMLEPAARATNASARVRQNLALAYALIGDWQKARVTAAQDLSPADLSGRLQQWAGIAQPQASYTQVAAVLGVTAVEDPGVPQHLALVQPAPATMALAAADTTPPPAVYAEPYTPPPVSAPIEVAAVEAAPAVNSPVEVAEAEVESKLAAVFETLVKPQPAVKLGTVPVADAPIPTFKAARQRASLDVRPASKGVGRFVVQIGAYRTQRQTEQAWAVVQRRYRLDREPLSTTVTIPGKGLLHRLSLAGFETQLEASRTCGSIRNKGGACFVRTAAGDAPMQWASKASAKTA